MFYNKKNNNFYLVNNGSLYTFTSNRTWEMTNEIIENLVEVSKAEAIMIYQKSKYKITTPVGVIGTKTPTDAQYLIAKQLGELLSNLGFTVLCGGKEGVMKAVCEGVAINNGVSIGILPGIDPNEANEYVSIPITSGIGFARNTIIAAASMCLIAVGGSHGTLSEIAFGLQYNKEIMAFLSDFNIANITHLTNPDEIISHLFSLIFNY